MADFKNSKTKENLMRAFAGESQARNRYTMAQEKAKEQKLHVIAKAFEYTANQEKVHAEIFYNHLNSESGETVFIDGGYPVNISNNVCELLKMAAHDEFQEADDVYPNFAKTAREEGFSKIAQDFENIAKIEKVHGNRFKKYAELMENDKLYKKDECITWICENCGYIFEGKNAPQTCPVCTQTGYFKKFCG